MKKKHIVLTAALSAIAAAGAFAQNSSSNFYERTEVARVDQGLRIAPVPLKYTQENKYNVGLGSYLVNSAGGCNNCHTNPSYAKGGDPFLGQKKKVNSANYLAGGQLFGPFVSRNLTPKNGLPAGRTWPQFLQEMRTGVDLGHKHPQFGPLLQVMPWPTYQDLTDHDLRAIYERLKAIPPAKPGM